MSKRARNTEFLNASAEGTPAAVERLLPLIYDELRDLAEQYLRSERRASPPPVSPHLLFAALYLDTKK